MLLDLLARIQLDAAKLDLVWPQASKQQDHQLPPAALCVLVRCSAVSRHWREAAQLAAGHLSAFRFPVQHASPLLACWAHGWPHLQLDFPAHLADPARVAPVLRSCSGLRRLTLNGYGRMSLEDAEAIQQAVAAMSGLQELELFLDDFKPTTAFPGSLQSLTIGSLPDYTVPELAALLEQLQDLESLSNLNLDLAAEDACFPAASLSHVDFPFLDRFIVTLKVARTGKPDLTWFANPDRCFQLCLCVAMDNSADGLLGFCQQAASLLRSSDLLIMEQLPCGAAQQALAPLSGLCYFLLCVRLHAPADSGAHQIVALPQADLVRLRIVECECFDAEMLVRLSWDLLVQQPCRVEISLHAGLPGRRVVLGVTGFDGHLPEGGPWQLGITGASAVQGLPVVKSGKDFVLRNKAAERQAWKYDADNWNW